ncbi:MAG: hypothetical protein IPK59_05005 [Rhodospirillaceae bacterium]|nr:hypothetical protein [Rhodospirillaceae bacterium]
MTGGFASAASILFLAATAAAAAPRPVAIVEDSPRVEGKFQAFDLVSEGETVQLGAGETIVLGYLKSCLRQTITGGVVIIGASESQVSGGKVSSEKTECAVNKLALAQDESQQSATIAFRGKIKHIHTRQPIILASKSPGVTIEPIDGGDVWRIVPENGRVDFQAMKLEMQPGRSYRVVGTTQTVIVEVDAEATAAKTGLLERVVIVDPETEAAD